MSDDIDVDEVAVEVADELEIGEVRRIDVGGTAVCLVRCSDGYRAVADTCSHADVSLAEGEVYPDSDEIECYAHGSLFSLLTGEALTLPATLPVAVFRTEVVDGTVIVRAPAR